MTSPTGIAVPYGQRGKTLDNWLNMAGNYSGNTGAEPREAGDPFRANLSANVR